MTDLPPLRVQQGHQGGRDRSAPSRGRKGFISKPRAEDLEFSFSHEVSKDLPFPIYVKLPVATERRTLNPQWPFGFQGRKSTRHHSISLQARCPLRLTLQHTPIFPVPRGRKGEIFHLRQLLKGGGCSPRVVLTGSHGFGCHPFICA